MIKQKADKEVSLKKEGTLSEAVAVSLKLPELVGQMVIYNEQIGREGQKYAQNVSLKETKVFLSPKLPLGNDGVIPSRGK